MAATLERKNGGPYTKSEQDKRRNEVYTLHFEKGYSAVKIAEMINANRNTVNEDIKYWYLQISADFEKSNLPGLWVLKQYNRLENQRGRLLDELEKQDRLRDKLNIERMILEIDVRVSDLAIKIGPIKNEKEKHEISEEKISNIVKEIINNADFSFTLKKERIISEIIRITKLNQTWLLKFLTK